MLLLWFIWVSFLWWQASSTVWVLAVLNELFFRPVSKAVTNVTFYRGLFKPNNHNTVPHLVLFCGVGGELTFYLPRDLMPGPDWMEETWSHTLLFPSSYLDDAWLRYDVVFMPVWGSCSDVFMGERRMDVAFPYKGSKAEPPGLCHVYLFLYPEDEM